MMSSADTEIIDDFAARQSRWGSLINDLEDDWDDDDMDDADQNINQTAPGLRAYAKGTTVTGIGTGSQAPGLFKSFGMDGFNFNSRGPAGQNVQSPDTGTTPLSNWILSRTVDSRGRISNDISAKRKYLEEMVHILHSLMIKIGGENHKTAEEKVGVHPNFITVANVIVSDLSSSKPSEKQFGQIDISADFAACGDSIFHEDNIQVDETRMKYSAMDALGRIAYEMCMLGDGPSLDTFSRASINDESNGESNEAAESIAPQEVDEEDIIGMLAKNSRTSTSEGNNESSLVSTMLSANVPFPLCRFVSDLLDSEQGGMLGRSEHSFSSFKEVISDLKQMMDNPEKFLHDSSPDRWKLSFGDKLYGREQETRAFMNAAERMTTVMDDPIFGGLVKVIGKRREVIMVSGHSGSGKSRLVTSGGSSLEKRGWRFLRCKFDRTVHPESLSILSYAFDEYFGSFTNSNDQGIFSDSDLSNKPDLHSTSLEGSKEMCQRLKEIICPEGLRILAKHIPSLHLILDIELPSVTGEVKENMMIELFRKLLTVISSKRNPVLFFIDDLQWADPLSLTLLTALTKGSDPDFFHPSPTRISKQNEFEADNLQEDTFKEDAIQEDECHVMFVGSYRDNEVDEQHPLAKVLGKFNSDKSINMTSISLSRFTYETLNEMLSNTLSVPVRRVRSLSKLVIQKTDGQPLHGIEFIQALTMDNLLTHSFDRGWEWDADSIDICPITECVAELYAFKLQRLPKNILRGLQILSLFGSQIDQRVINFVADYDGGESVDIAVSIQVASKEGLVERAAQLVSFSHDMIQKATLDSIQALDLVLLLRKIAGALIRNASTADELDSVLFVAVDLINRIGSDSISCPEEGEMFAELNLRAGSKAITVPDFAGGAKYAENGITFLNDAHWETQYELSLGLYEIAVVSHFSSMEGNRDQLKTRINAVFEHAKDFSDKFKTHCVWIKLLSLKSIPKAIQESLTALERLGEPLDLIDIDNERVGRELVSCKTLSGEMEKQFLSKNAMTDCNKMRAMKIMSSLIIYYHLTQSSLGAYVGCHMIKMSLNYGHCEDSVSAAACTAAALVYILEDIDEGTNWGRMALSMLKKYDNVALVPSIHAALYGIVFHWKEPIQSTLEPLAQGIRVSFVTGSMEFALANIAYYVTRSLNSGKNIRVLTGEVEALASQHGNHFGSDGASGAPIYSPLLQFYLTPLYNVLREYEGDEGLAPQHIPSFPLDKVQFVQNDDIMKAATEMGQNSCIHIILTYQTTRAFMFRDMDGALKHTDRFCDLFSHILMRYTSIYNVFYEALITLYFMRQTGDENYLVRGENALKKIEEWAVYSEWNLKNKLLLIQAELHNTKRDFDTASKYYEAAVKASKEHKFIHEEAVASELAAHFFLERELRQQSQFYFMHSIKCYEKWGAFVLASRVRDIVESNFEIPPNDEDELASDFIVPHFIDVSLDGSDGPNSKKRLWDN